jgi:hypothetical protein
MLHQPHTTYLIACQAQRLMLLFGGSSIAQVKSDRTGPSLL